MGHGVDPLGEPGDHRDPGRGQGAGEEVGRLFAVGVRPAGADDGHGGAGRHLAAQVEHGRRWGELAQAGRVVVVLQGDDPAAQAFRLGGLAGGGISGGGGGSGGGDAGHGQGPLHLAAGHAGRGGQGFGRCGLAEPAVHLLGQPVDGRAGDLGGGIQGNQQLASGWGGHGRRGLLSVRPL